MEIEYFLCVKDPWKHLFSVKISVSYIDNELYFTMPAWIPGSYLIRDFSRNIRNLRAFSGNKALKIEKVDKSTYKIECRGNVELYYDVYSNEFDVHTSHLDSEHGFFNGINVFMYIEEHKNNNAKIFIKPYSGWYVSTPLKIIGNNEYFAENYDILADSPFEIGKHKIINFTLDKKIHNIIIYGNGSYNADKIKNNIIKIVETVKNIFGDLPYDDYYFIFHLSDKSWGGGLEHLNSFTLNINRNIFDTEEGYISFFAGAAHEFFHLFNVKRIRPVELGPFDYKHENYTKLLWFSEGFTNYYEYIILLRSGIINEQQYFNYLAEHIRIYNLIPGRFVESLSESSFDAWTRLYKPSEDDINSYISYYLKGELVGFILSVNISLDTDGKKSLDNVFKELYKEFKSSGNGFIEDHLKYVISSVAGKNYDKFFNRYINGTDDIDFNYYFNIIGYKITKNYNSEYCKKPENTGFLGIILKNDNGNFIIISLLNNYPGYNYGLNSGDRIISINDNKFDERYIRIIKTGMSKIIIDNLIDFNYNETVKITVLRSDKLLNFNIKLEKNIYDFYNAEKTGDTKFKAKVLYNN